MADTKDYMTSEYWKKMESKPYDKWSSKDIEKRIAYLADYIAARSGNRGRSLASAGKSGMTAQQAQEELKKLQKDLPERKLAEYKSPSFLEKGLSHGERMEHIDHIKALTEQRSQEHDEAKIAEIDRKIAEERKLLAQDKKRDAEESVLSIKRSIVREKDPACAKVLKERLAALQRQLAVARREFAQAILDSQNANAKVKALSGRTTPSSTRETTARDSEKGNAVTTTIAKTGKVPEKIPQYVMKEAKRLGGRITYFSDSNGNRVYRIMDQEKKRTLSVMLSQKGVDGAEIPVAYTPEVEKAIQSMREKYGKPNSDFSAEFAVIRSQESTGIETKKFEGIKIEAPEIKLPTYSVEPQSLMAGIAVVPRLKENGKLSKLYKDILYTDEKGHSHRLTKDMVKAARKEQGKDAVPSWKKMLEAAEKGELKPDEIAKFFAPKEQTTVNTAQAQTQDVTQEALSGKEQVDALRGVSSSGKETLTPLQPKEQKVDLTYVDRAQDASTKHQVDALRGITQKDQETLPPTQPKEQKVDLAYVAMTRQGNTGL